MHLPPPWPAALATLALLAAQVGCSPPTSPVHGQAYVVQIQNDTFVPTRLEVPPGATILFMNRDPWLHWAASEAVAGSFTVGAVNGVQFDTGPFPRGEYPVALAADAPVGTVVPYFDRLLGSGMTNRPEIAIVAPPP